MNDHSAAAVGTGGWNSRSLVGTGTEIQGGDVGAELAKAAGVRKPVVGHQCSAISGY